MTLRDLHESFAWFVIVANGLAGGWALAAHRWPALRRREGWWFTILAEVSIVVQVVLGVALVAHENLETPKFHAFYGFVALAVVGIIYSYRQQLAGRLYLLYGLGGLFLMGLAIRAMVLGGR